MAEIISERESTNSRKHSDIVRTQHKESFGLTYKSIPEKADAQSLLKGSIPLLKSNPELSVVQNENVSGVLFPVAPSTNHALIEGDNLSVLTALQYTHKNKIDAIYIDPPYNTGNRTFVYTDKYAGRSAWLTFMRVRLELAKNLLTDTGVIFVSIDENEHAYLKVLMDEIFGEKNFVGEAVRKTKSTTNDISSGFNIQHEYLIIYGKTKQIHLSGVEKDFSRYKNPDNDPLGPWVPSDPSARTGTEKNNWFPVVNPNTLKEDYPPSGRFWRFSKNTIQKHIDEGTIVFKKTHKQNERGFIYKRHLSQLKNTRSIMNSLDTATNEYMNQAATKELRNIIGNCFSYPKSVGFLKQILSFVPDNAIVLDFFAGSGTTGQAVVELNAADGGSRQCILVTNNENGIAEKVTAERMRRVLTGQNWFDGENHPSFPGNLLYYTTILEENVQNFLKDFNGFDNFWKSFSPKFDLASYVDSVHEIVVSLEDDGLLVRENSSDSETVKSPADCEYDCS